MRRFHLERRQDVHGVSGEGIVAEGVEFENGGCVITWLSPFRTVAYYENVKALEKVHGHEGATIIVWIDQGDNDHQLTKERMTRILEIARKLGVSCEDGDSVDTILSGMELII